MMTLHRSVPPDSNVSAIEPAIRTLRFEWLTQNGVAQMNSPSKPKQLATVLGCPKKRNVSENQDKLQGRKTFFKKHFFSYL
jgi:hypothetical protein